MESEYRCQPGSILAVSLASTLAPGGAAEVSSASDHFDRIGPLGEDRAGEQKKLATQPRRPCEAHDQSDLGGRQRGLADQRCNSFSMRLLIWPLENSAATRMAFFMALALRAAVADDADPAHAQQRRAAVLGVVEPLLEIGEGGLGEHVADLARDGGLQGFLQHALDHVHQAFADLQSHVADEAVADDDVGLAAVDVAAPRHCR